MHGATTHVSVSKISTDCTTELKKKLYICIAAPSLLIILVNLRHTARAFDMFLTSSVQLSSAAEITCSNYLKEFTISRGRPYALKSLNVTTLSSSAVRRRRFCSTPFLH